MTGRMPMSHPQWSVPALAPLIRAATLCRRVSDGDDSVREIRISCPDATGLGCDITRMLLDFGLRILSGVMHAAWCIVRDPAAVELHLVTSCPLRLVLTMRELVAGDVSTDGKWCFLIIKVAWHGIFEKIAQHFCQQLVLRAVAVLQRLLSSGHC